MKRLIFIAACLALAATRPAEENSPNEKAFASAGSYVYTDSTGKVQNVLYTSDESGIKITSSNVRPEDVQKIIEQIQNQMNFMPVFPMFSFGFPFGRDLKRNSQDANKQDEEEAPFLSALQTNPKVNKPKENQESVATTETPKENEITKEKQEPEQNVVEHKKIGKMMDVSIQKTSEFICIPKGLRPCDENVIINITDNKTKEETSSVVNPTESSSDDVEASAPKTNPIISQANDIVDSKPYPPYILEDAEESKPFAEEEDLESKPYATSYLGEKVGAEEAKHGLYVVGEDPGVYAAKVQHRAIHDIIRSFLNKKKN